MKSTHLFFIIGGFGILLLFGTQCRKKNFLERSGSGNASQSIPALAEEAREWLVQHQYDVATNIKKPIIALPTLQFRDRYQIARDPGLSSVLWDLEPNIEPETRFAQLQYTLREGNDTPIVFIKSYHGNPQTDTCTLNVYSGSGEFLLSGIYEPKKRLLYVLPKTPTENQQKRRRKRSADDDCMKNEKLMMVFPYKKQFNSTRKSRSLSLEESDDDKGKCKKKKKNDNITLAPVVITASPHSNGGGSFFTGSISAGGAGGGIRSNQSGNGGSTGSGFNYNDLPEVEKEFARKTWAKYCETHQAECLLIPEAEMKKGGILEEIVINAQPHKNGQFTQTWIAHRLAHTGVSYKGALFGYTRTKKDENNNIIDKHHNGIDITMKVGTPLYPILDKGKVIDTKYSTTFGNKVAIVYKGMGENGKDLLVMYAHLSEVSVAEETTVNQSTLVGRSGRTGNAENVPVAHVHIYMYEGYDIKGLTYRGRFLIRGIDPAKYLKLQFNLRTGWQINFNP